MENTHSCTNYSFSCVDIGSYGSNNNAGIFKNSKVGEKIENNEMGLPDDSFNMDRSPYYFVRIFPFIVMKPYVEFINSKLKLVIGVMTHLKGEVHSFSIILYVRRLKK